MKIEQFLFQQNRIYNEYNFNEWRNKGVINLGVGSNLSISLLQGLIRIIRIPKNLIALLIGEPFYFVSTSTSKHTISSQIKNDFKNQIQKKFRYKIKSTGFLNQMSTMQFIAEDYLADALSKIERGELVIKEGQNIKDVLLFYCYHQFTIEFGKMLGKEGERQLNESEIQYLQQNFLAYQIIEPVIRERNVDYKQISIEYNQQRIDLLKEYQLDSQYQLASALFKNLQSFELKYPPSHGYFFDFIEFKNGSLKADTYFWKFKYIMQMLKESCVSSNSLKDTLIYGKYGWEVCFKAESKQNGYKTLTRRFQDIKNEINRSQRQGDEDDDSDGIFGPCCSIAYECCNNYLYKYFLKGILFTSIFLRLICLSWLIIFGALYIIQFVSLRPIFVSIYLFNILIYDFTLPDTNIYTYPKYFPLFMIIFRFFLAVLTIILYSYVLVSSIAIECVKYICYWTLTVPTRIKNSLSYLLIYFLAQVPQTDSKYCKQDKNIYKDSYQYYQLTFEQIKIFIDSYFQKIPFEILIQNLDIYMKNQDAQNKLFLQKINNYLPFSSQQSKIQEMCQHYQKHFKKNLEEMIKTIESKFIQIQYNSNMSFKYSKQEYNKLFQNVSDYLRTKYGSQKKFEKMWSYFNCEQDNYDDFTLQMLNLIFFNKKFDKNESKLSLIFNMEKDQNILNQVNIYLQNKYDMQPDSITKADLNFQVCFFNFINEYNI